MEGLFLRALYEEMLEDRQCVLDTTNFEGGELLDWEGDLEELTCMTRGEYDAIRYGRPGE